MAKNYFDHGRGRASTKEWFLSQAMDIWVFILIWVPLCDIGLQFSKLSKSIVMNFLGYYFKCKMHTNNKKKSIILLSLEGNIMKVGTTTKFHV